MLRLGKTANIHQQYEECRLTFGCPANWIRYAKQDSRGIADEYEAIWGHVRKNDPRLSQICDDGAPLNSSRSLWTSEDRKNNDYIYVRYIYFCLTPSLCFYSRDIQNEVIKCEEKLGKRIEFLDVDILPYINSLGLNVNDCSFLLISYPGKLIEELKVQIPIAIKNAKAPIDISDFDPLNPLCVRPVDYTLDIDKEFFVENLHSYSPLFTKKTEYINQHEARIFIPNVNFITDPLIEEDKYDPKNFELSVTLPNLHEYAFEIPAKGKDIMRFDSFDEERKNYHVKI